MTEITTPRTLADVAVRSLRFGVFEMDLRSGELRKDGMLVKLAHQPFELLAFLARRPGDVVSREEIQRRLWGDGIVVEFDQRLNTCVKQIRAALNDDADVPRYLETLPKRGYRWLAPVEALGPEGVTRAERPALRLVDAPAERRDAPQAPAEPARHASSPWLSRLHAAVTLAALVAVGVLLARRPEAPALPSWRQVSFRRGVVNSARFAPGGEILFGAAWDATPARLFSTRAGWSDARAIDLEPKVSRLVGVSPTGEVAFLEQRGVSILNRLPAAGGAPRAVAERVVAADWLPDGRDLVAVRYVDGRRRLEFPLGRTIAEVEGAWALRVSPDGERVAVALHPAPNDDAGYVAVFDRQGGRRELTSRWASLHGLAWAPSGQEVWFTAASVGTNLGLYAVDLSGRLRPILPANDRLVLHDISRDGAVLCDRVASRFSLFFGRPGGSERELSWFDTSWGVRLTADGRNVLFYEGGEAVGPDYAIFLRPTDGAPPVQLGSGAALDLSPDGKWVVAVDLRVPDHLTLLPTGLGRSRPLRDPQIQQYLAAGFFPDGQRLLVTGRAGDGPAGLYELPLDGGPARRLVDDEGVMVRNLIAPDGKSVVRKREAALWLVPLDGSAAQRIPASDGLMPLFWDESGRRLYARDGMELPARIVTIDPASGERRPWLEVRPSDPVGISDAFTLVGTPDGKAYAYSFIRTLSELFVVEGLR
jgi:DNA-binding winged helix-turn-helix (wHTH) protein